MESLNNKSALPFTAGRFVFGNGEGRRPRRNDDLELTGGPRWLSVAAVLETAAVGEDGGLGAVDDEGDGGEVVGGRRGRTVGDATHGTLLREGGLDVRDTINGSSRTGEE